MNEAIVQPQNAPKTLIVGLGKTGLACARFLAARGVPLAVTDSRLNPPGLVVLREELPDVAMFLGGFEPAAFAQAEQLVLSPGVPLSEPIVAQAVQRGLPVLGDIEVFARYVDAPVVAITGSNGKSTVTTLVGEMAAAAGRDVRVGGNLGTPALELLSDTAPELYVLELSSFQLETTSSLDAAAAVVLNLSPDHMDRHADLDAYADAKRRVFNGSGTQVLNADDARVAAMADPARPCLWFSLEAPRDADSFGVIEHQGEPWLARGATPLMPAREVRIEGLHNRANALAALALGAAIGLPLEPMCTVLRRYAGLAHRSQRVAARDGVAWYDDSKGTNVGATLAALQGVPGAKVVLILGGEGKGADFSALREPVAARARAVVLIGRDAALIESVLAGVVPVVHAADMQAAVAAAQQLAQAGDAVLLSPACASFDMFKNYEHRGQVFADAVRGLLA